jgi:hypothetical protein
MVRIIKNKNMNENAMNHTILNVTSFTPIIIIYYKCYSCEFKKKKIYI